MARAGGATSATGVVGAVRPEPAAARLAVIELGSNSFHLLVVGGRGDGGWDTVLHHREQLPLADTVVATGRIGSPLAEEAVRVVRDMCALAGSHRVGHVITCATHAFREAEDARCVLGRIRDEAGVEVQVITGEEEAALAYAAVAASMPLGGPALVADLGGGSLDLAVGDSTGVRWARSVGIGAAVLAARSEGRSGASDRSQEALADAVLIALRRAGEPPFAVDSTVGTGGTLGSVARARYAWAGERVPPTLNRLRLTAAELELLGEEAASLPVSQRQRKFDLSRRRAALLPAGIAVALGCLRWSGVEELTLCDWGLREGLVLAALGRGPGQPQNPASLREASVQALRSRHPVDEMHAAQVAWLAAALFDRTVLLHHLGPGDRELLRFGALIVEIGRSVGAEDYERHTAYLVEHAGLRGFGPEEIAVLACLGRFHRGGRPKDDFDAFVGLPEERRAAVVALTALLQIAVALDRSRRSLIEGIDVHLTPDSIVLSLRASRPPHLELSALTASRRLFERTFGRGLAVQPGFCVSSDTLEASA